MTPVLSDSQWEALIAQTIQAVEPEPSTLKKHDYPALNSKDFARCMDHTLLKLDATPAQIDVLCNEAREYGFKV